MRMRIIHFGIDAFNTSFSLPIYRDKYFFITFLNSILNAEIIKKKLLRKKFIT